MPQDRGISGSHRAKVLRQASWAVEPFIEAGYSPGAPFLGEVVRKTPGPASFIEHRNSRHGPFISGEFPARVEAARLSPGGKAKIAAISAITDFNSDP